ncbi:metallophosphoesterase family protein [Candidatus Thiosymbion oneisti]|uniref:metallophosphoesterase family protein n=1 Tax=Candidatus Thiosymbion oneisti TaxID=589554 RepID=UPI000A722973|nr:DNA repair exonuclease [Candidatus Thiosymbion oneisti]
MSLTLLHTADWQLGKQFAQVPGDAGATLRLRRLDTVKAIAELARERQVDAVLVAGDVFEDNAVSDETLRRTMHALAPFEGPWVLLPGNHDAGLTQSAWSRLRRLAVVPANVILADRPEPIVLCGGRLVVLPAPLRRRHEVGDLTEWYDTLRSDAGVLRVGLAHGAVTNRLPETAEAHNPVADTRVETASLDYLALGDWHGTLEVANRTWYAGTPEPDRFKTNEPGNVLLVTLREGGAPSQVEKVPVGYYRWVRLTFDIMDDQALAVLDSRLAALGESERTLVRLKLTGTVDLATRQQLDERLDGWRARLHFLEVDDTALLARTGPDDLAALIAELGATGFVRDAIETLVGIEGDAGHPDQADAGRALQILYREHKALRQ